MLMVRACLQEEKYRRVRLSNEKIRARIVDVDGALEVLEELGWKHEEDTVVLPANVNATMVQFRQVEEAREKLVREQRRKAGTQRTTLSKEQQRLREQLEADRKERMAELPVTRPSIAKPLEGGPKVRSGLVDNEARCYKCVPFAKRWLTWRLCCVVQITTAGDLGLNKNCCN